MSQKTVQLIIGRILTDDDLRERFVQEPARVLSGLRDAGYELTDAEAEALADTPVRVWTTAAGEMHPRLQRCRLLPE
jgi:hypothetical protein